ncbi:MAG TPA: hypothetical protein VKF40_18015 [Burkholderiales bacterium]|nr:hypothetical protein [Burkholderiales bacterium]
MSRRTTRVLTLVAVIAALVAACARTEWREVETPDGGFRILMQGDPRVEKSALDTPSGQITGNLYLVEVKDAAFGVGYSDFPVAIVQEASPRQLFSVVRDGWMKRIQGKLQNDGTDIKLENKYPGMEFAASGQLDGRDAYLRGRLYLVDNRLYQVIVFGTKSAMPVSDINQFLGSFKLVPRHETATVKIEANKKP